MAEIKIVKVGSIRYVPAEMGDTVRTHGRSYEVNAQDRIHIPFGIQQGNVETRIDVILNPAEAQVLFRALNDALVDIPA